jgi:predicted nucleic acid-binding protein
MNVIVDTPVWSLALRRNSPQNTKEVKELRELINEYRVILIGPIRQELLSGISDPFTFITLKEKLGAFEDHHLTTTHFEYAAELSNTCRKNGIQGSHTDFLICSVSILHDYSIFTVDDDFRHYQRFLKIRLHDIRDDN